MGEAVYSTCEKCSNAAEVWWVRHIDKQRCGRWLCGSCLAICLEHCLALAEAIERTFYENE